MKRELLRIHNLSLQTDGSHGLSGVSFCLTAGECTAFMGLANSGVSLLLDVLSGKLGASGEFWVDQTVVARPRELAQYTYRITASNFRIEDWSAAEYLGLVDHRIFGLLRHKTLVGQAQNLFAELGLALDANARLRDLSELDKRLVDLAKACIQDKKIVIIEDEFEGCTTKDIMQFREVLDTLPKEDLTYIVSSHSDDVCDILSDRYVFFKKGRIVKKCPRRDLPGADGSENYLLDRTTTTRRRALAKVEKADGSDKTVYTAQLQLTHRAPVRLDFYKKEVATLLVRDTKLKEEVFGVLSGRRTSRESTVALEGIPLPHAGVESYVRNRVVSVSHLGGTEELLPRMTAGENLAIPSLHKLSGLRYTAHAHKLGRVLTEQLEAAALPSDADLRQLEANDYIVLELERWYIYRPKVLILFEPFVRCDLYGVSLIQSYIKKFTAIGATVIIVKSREEYVEELSDRIVALDH